jgi:hypothetical protein
MHSSTLFIQSDQPFDYECRRAKRRERHLERKASVSNSADAAEGWMKAHRSYRSLLQSKREQFWTQKIESEQSTHHLVNYMEFVQWMRRWIVVSLYPLVPSSFVDTLMKKGHPDAQWITAGAPVPSLEQSSTYASFNCFQAVRLNEVVAAVKALPDKSCKLDPGPY